MYKKYEVRGKLADKKGLLQKRIEALNDYDFGATKLIAVLKILEEAKQAVGSLKWMDELKGYVEKHAPKLDENTPIFSTRYFLKKIDEQKEWFATYFGVTSGETRGNSDRT